MPAPALNPTVPPARVGRAHVPVHPPGFLEAPGQYGFLIAQLTRKEVVGRYRGSYLGIFWSFINPLLLLCVYTAVFLYIFTTRTMAGHASESRADFALGLFSALIIFNLFAECLTRSPSLILLNGNYVTKVVFPLEILPLTVVLGALVHLFIGAVPLYLATYFARGHLHATAALWPLLLVPITLWAIAGSWLLAALGAFLRDLSEVMIALTQVLMYASAVFYPLSALRTMPAAVQWMVKLNPLSYLNEQSRALMVWGDPMDWTAYGWVCLGGMLAAWMSYKIFMSVKPAFADVI